VVNLLKNVIGKTVRAVPISQQNNVYESVKKFCFTDNYEKISNWCNEKVGHGKIEDEDLCDGLEFFIEQDRQNNQKITFEREVWLWFDA